VRWNSGTTGVCVISGSPKRSTLVFFQRSGVGPYRLYSPAGDGPEALVKRSASLEFGDGAGRRRNARAVRTFTENPYYEALQRIDPEVAYASFSLIPTEGDYTGGVTSTATVGSEICAGKLENARNYHLRKAETSTAS